jgi:hypothetical protein
LILIIKFFIILINYGKRKGYKNNFNLLISKIRYSLYLKAIFIHQIIIFCSL